MRLKVVTNALGAVLKYIGLVILLPIFFALYYKEYNAILPFLAAGLISASLGFLMNLQRVNEKEMNETNKIEALSIVFFSWVFFGIICAIPYLFFNFTQINALFEAVSGITTTGATIIVDFSLYPKAMFVFRGLTQWLGGMGIIVLFIAILPKFSVAGRQMFFAEAPGPVEEKITPRIRHTATWLWAIYIALTVIQILLLKFVAGMDFYNAICNSFTTLAAGGLSPNPQSILGYHNNLATIIITIFMFLAGANFVLQYKVFIQGRFGLIFKSEEFKTYLGIVLLISLSIAGVLWAKNNVALGQALIDAFFQSVSIITTTGFASVDFQKWSTDAKILLFVMMFIGGCAGSTGGGIKVVRWIFIFKYLKKEISKIVHPKGVYPIKLEGMAVSEDIRLQLLAFVIFYIAIFALSTFCVALIEENTTIAITGSITTLGNIGPGFGQVIGPMGSFDPLQTSTKGIFVFNMLVGRLELVPFLALLHPDLWQQRN